MENSPIHSLQQQLLENDTPISSSLRYAKLISSKLDLPDTEKWIDKELGGYEVETIDQLPEYRQARGIPMALNPYRGWQAIQSRDAQSLEKISSVGFIESIGRLEELYQDGQTELHYRMSVNDQNLILNSIKPRPSDVAVHVEPTQLFSVIEKVRNLIIDWTLNLEKAGILGEGLMFSAEEKKEASAVSHSYVIQNVGVLGNIADNANVRTNQSAYIEPTNIKSILDEIQKAVPLLPEALESEAKPLIAELTRYADDDEQDVARYKKALESLKRICENATGSVAAQGILGLIKNILT